MKISEWLKKGNKRCECEKVNLIYFKKIMKRRIRKFNWIKDYTDILNGNIKYRNIIRWIAICDQCRKIYLVTSTKKNLLNELNISKFCYSNKKGA